MLRFFARLIGYWLMAGGVVLAVVDGTRSLAASALVLTDLAAAWSALSLASMRTAEQALAGLPWLWDPLILAGLRLPAALALFLAGIALVALGTRAPRPFEIAA